MNKHNCVRKIDWVTIFLRTLASFCIVLLFSRLSFGQSTGSNSSFNFETSVETVTACGAPAAFRVKLTAVVSLSGNSVSVTMPVGVEYVPVSSGGGLTILSGTVTEGNISNLAAPVFTIGDLAVGQVVEFTYAVKATCGIIPYVEALNVPANSYSFNSTSPSRVETFNTVGFNVLYGVPSIIDVVTNGTSTPGYAGNIGDVIERKVLIKNGGNGAITSDTYLELDGTYTYSSIGGPYSTGATLTGSRLALSTAAFGGDGIWSADETIEVTYQETITSCPVGTPSRNIFAGYGCSSTDCKISQIKATQVSTPFLPNLQIKGTINRPMCMGESPTEATITIVNKGQGSATNFRLRHFNNSYVGDIYGYIDTLNTTYTLNGGASQHITTVGPFNFSTLPATNRLCSPGSTPNVLSDAFLKFGTLAPGDSLVVTLHYSTCLGTGCGIVRNIRPEANAHWTAGCSSEEIVRVDLASNNLDNSQYSEVTIKDIGEIKITGENQPFDIGFNYENTIGSDFASLGGEFEVCVTVPAGLILDETQANSFYLRNVFDNSVTWYPTSHTRSGNTVCYRFDQTPLGNRWTAGSFYDRLFKGGAEQHLVLSQDCASGSGVLPVSFSYSVRMSDDCSLWHQVGCYTRDVVSLCPAPCATGGLSALATTAERISLGLPDNNNDGIVDASGSLDLSKILHRQYMVGDTMKYAFKGAFSAASDLTTYPLNTEFEHAYLEVGLDMAYNFEALGGAQIVLKKFSGGTVVYPLNRLSGNSYKLYFNDPVLGGYVFQPGDTLEVEQLLRVKAAAGVQNQTVFVTSPYASHVTDPVGSNRYGCGVSYDAYRINTFWVSADNGFYTECNGLTLGGSTGMDVRFGGAEYGAGYSNAFPFEHRHLGSVDKMKFILPPGFEYDPMSTPFVKFFEGPDDGTTRQDFLLSAPEKSGDTLIFDISGFYSINGGAIALTDEGFRVAMHEMKIRPICGTPEGVYKIKSLSTFMVRDSVIARLMAQGVMNYGTPHPSNQASYSGNQLTRYLSTTEYAYSISEIHLNPISTVSNSEDGTVNYQVQLSNDNPTTQTNVWLRPNNDYIAITRLVDQSTNTVLMPDANGFFQLGNFPAGQIRNYTLHGTLGQCEDGEDLVFVGGGCATYPAAMGLGACATDTLLLEAHPGETDFQTILTGPNTEVPLCDDADFSFEVKASKLGNVKDLLVNFQLPSGSSIVPGSVMYSYPGDATAVTVADPSALTGTVAFNVSGYSAHLTNIGLRGVGTSDADSSEVKVSFKVRTDCSFTPGARFLAEYRANDACGNALDPRANTADLAIPGLGALPYRTTVLLITADTAHCAETSTKLLVNITNVVGGTATGSNDSVYVELPPNVSFSGYTYAANGGDYLNAPTGAPSVYGISGGYTRVAWLLPAGIPSGGSINFPLTYSLDGAGICELDSIHSYTGVVNSSSCSSAPGGSCDVLFLNSTVPGKTVPYYQPEIAMSYSMNSYCITDPNPVPVLSGCGAGQPGTFSASPAGLSIDVATGEIDPVGSVAGTYLVTYAIPSSGSSCVAASDSMSVTVKGESCPFPVVLVDFKARAVESNVELDWRTVREDNSDRFEVEHSIDGKYWSVLGRVSAKGTSNSEVRYNFKDSSPMSGQNVYRLKIVDRDGSYGYSRLENVRFEGSLRNSLYPNPVSDKLYLGMSDFGKVTGVELHDSGGRKVYDSGPRPVQELSMKHLSNGVYVASIHYKGGMTRIFKVVVNH